MRLLSLESFRKNYRKTPSRHIISSSWTCMEFLYGALMSTGKYFMKHRQFRHRIKFTIYTPLPLIRNIHILIKNSPTWPVVGSFSFRIAEKNARVETSIHLISINTFWSEFLSKILQGEYWNSLIKWSSLSFSCSKHKKFRLRRDFVASQLKEELARLSKLSSPFFWTEYLSGQEINKKIDEVVNTRGNNVHKISKQCPFSNWTSMKILYCVLMSAGS